MCISFRGGAECDFVGVLAVWPVIAVNVTEGLVGIPGHVVAVHYVHEAVCRRDVGEVAVEESNGARLGNVKEPVAGKMHIAEEAVGKGGVGTIGDQERPVPTDKVHKYGICTSEST